jgi:MFS family permease
MAVVRSPRALVPVLVFVGTVVAVISSLGAPLVPAVAETLGTSLPGAQWSLTATLLVGAVATPVVGRLGDGPHRRRVVLAVLGVVTLGGVLAALPLGLGWLIAGRALQGVGLGLTPLAMATAREALDGARSRSTVAALSVTVVTGVGLGYPLAGLVAELGGMRAAFWAGAAISLAALLACTAVLPPSTAAPRGRLDVVGALLLGAGLAALLFPLGRVERTAGPRRCCGCCSPARRQRCWRGVAGSTGRPGRWSTCGSPGDGSRSPPTPPPCWWVCRTTCC